MLRLKINFFVVSLIGCGFLVAQLLLYALLSTSIGANNLRDDLNALNEVCASVGIIMFLFDTKAVTFLENGYRFAPHKLKTANVQLLRFAIDSSLLHDPNSIDRKLIPALVSDKFLIESFYNSVGKPRFPEWPLALIIKRSSIPFLIEFLHDFEDNSWWYGNLLTDYSFLRRMISYNLDPTHFPNQESIITKFRLQPLTLNESKSTSNIWVPKYPAEFTHDMENSKFLECNYTRAKKFQSYLTQANHADNAKAAHFTHKVIKLLATVKTVLDGLKIPFWISSGTCLGYLRHCSVIPHSKDVDIGILASDFTETIISSFEKHEIKMKLWFGELNDSLELSFAFLNNLKLDIFFFYKESEIMWNGGTQLRTGKKYKYIFPKFDLCWTLFMGIKLRIPCDTESYIVANYGPYWYLPVVKWDWKTSPYNVKENGVWPLEKRDEVIRVFN